MSPHRCPPALAHPGHPPEAAMLPSGPLMVLSPQLSPSSHPPSDLSPKRGHSPQGSPALPHLKRAGITYFVHPSPAQESAGCTGE